MICLIKIKLESVSENGGLFAGKYEEGEIPWMQTQTVSAKNVQILTLLEDEGYNYVMCGIDFQFLKK